MIVIHLIPNSVGTIESPHLWLGLDGTSLSGLPVRSWAEAEMLAIGTLPV
jgi:hypothetical protein